MLDVDKELGGLLELAVGAAAAAPLQNCRELSETGHAQRAHIGQDSYSVQGQGIFTAQPLHALKNDIFKQGTKYGFKKVLLV